MDRTPWTGRRCVSKGSSRLRAWRKLRNWDLPISFRNCPDRPGLFALARVCVRACVRVQGLPASIAVLCCNNVCPPSWSGCREVQVLPTTPAAPSIEYPVSSLSCGVSVSSAQGLVHTDALRLRRTGGLEMAAYGLISASAVGARGFACAVCRCFSGHRHWRSRRLALARSEQA